MLDILRLHVPLDDFARLRLCQSVQRNDCHAAFTVRGMQAIWPVANLGETPAAERINVRGWFPLLDQMADEFLIWRPEGGCFFVFRDSVIYRIAESDARVVLFLQLELNRLAVVPPRQAKVRRASLRP